MLHEIIRFSSEALDDTGITVAALPGAGSDRKYYRITTSGGETFIATYGPDRKENNAFISLSAILFDNGINAPKIIAADPDKKIYLQEDLGDRSLYDLLKDEKFENYLSETVKQLAGFHCIDAAPIEGKLFTKPFGHRQIMWDLNYFKYSFLKPCGITFDEELLEDDFEKFASDLLHHGASGARLMYRDCQSRNVMIKDGKPYFIDFQGARIGPGLYDVASLLWQPRAGLNRELRNRMADIYCKEMQKRGSFDEESFRTMLPRFVAFRLLQVLGAYGFRGMVEKRAIFLSSIRLGLKQLKELHSEGAFSNYQELNRAIEALCKLTLFDTADEDGLTVYVNSFSYKKGYPQDFTGNGGGFALDCRAMHNPGRYAEYKHLTGRDKEVIDFLEQRGEVQKFVEAALLNVLPAVARYRDRGFTSLQVNFGCTGGQHRSVYCAERTAHEIAEKFPDVKVRLQHREQNITEWLNRK